MGWANGRWRRGVDPAGGGPALGHELEQVRHGFVVRLIPFGSELVCALAQLRGHLAGFLRRTTEGG
jgi:hypothetical protein